jgi:hypothetical protein
MPSALLWLTVRYAQVLLLADQGKASPTSFSAAVAPAVNTTCAKDDNTPETWLIAAQ